MSASSDSALTPLLNTRGSRTITFYPTDESANDGIVEDPHEEEEPHDQGLTDDQGNRLLEEDSPEKESFTLTYNCD